MSAFQPVLQYFAAGSDTASCQVFLLKSRHRSNLFALHSAMREPSLSERVENHGNS